MQRTQHGWHGDAGAQRRRTPGLAFARVLSRAELHPLEAVTWASRDVHLPGEPGEPQLTLREVELPADWSTAAALAFLDRHEEVSLPEAAAAGLRLSVRLTMERLLGTLQTEGSAGSVFATDQDAAVFCEELAVLLLTQGAALAGTRALRTDWLWSTDQGRPQRVDDHVADAGRQRGSQRLWDVADPEIEALLAQPELPADLRAGVLLLPDALLAEADQGQEPALLPHLCRAILREGGPAVAFEDSLRRAQWTGRENARRASLCASRTAGMLNLQRFLLPRGDVDLPALRHAVVLMTTALEIRVDRTPQPSEEECRQAHALRPLALGVGNAGAMLMSAGLAYGSAVARAVVAALAAVVAGEALRQSARIAETCPALPETADGSGTFPRFAENRNASLEAVRQGRAEAFKIGRGGALQQTPAIPVGGVLLFRRTAAQPESAGGALAEQLAQLVQAARSAWDSALVESERFGLRNAGVTALDETGMLCTEMDCDAPGLEPEPGLLMPERRDSGGATALQVHTAAAAGLFRLGYGAEASEAIQHAWEAGPSAETVPFLRLADRAVFACSGTGATYPLPPMEPLRMLGAAAPFLHAGTPPRLLLTMAATEADVRQWLLEAWRNGLQAIRLERIVRGPAQNREDRVSRDQAERPASAGMVSSAALAATDEDIPAVSGENGDEEHEMAHTLSPMPAADPAPEPIPRTEESDLPGGTAMRSTLAEAEQAQLAREQAALVESQLHRIAELEVQVLQLRQAATASADAFDAKEPPRTVRHRLPAERASVTHKFSVGGHDGYITVGLYPDGSPGEIFLRMARESSLVGGLLDAFAMSASLGLQHGVPLKTLTEHLGDMRFEPAGETPNPQISYARSIMDYLCRWLELRFLSGDQMDLFGGIRPAAAAPAIPITGTVSGDGATVTPRIRPVSSHA